MTETRAKRVAISQPYIILGGRLEVILGIARALNDLGIVPDILCLGTAFAPDEMLRKYGSRVKLNFKPLLQKIPWRKLPANYQVLLFNALLGRLSNQYDLLIDSSNSQIFLPNRKNVISYVHYPLEARIAADRPNINIPDRLYQDHPGMWLSNRFLRFMYKTFKPALKNRVVCNSRFTRDAFVRSFPKYPHDIQIIYPLVRYEQYASANAQRERAIASLGRFAPDKGQMEIIKLAQQLPEIQFHLIGFVQKPQYYNLCQEYIDANQIQNVRLHANAGMDEVVALLGSCKYFLHTLINEPFGLSSVQAIAAGCLPLVHDSGGQRETVPYENLRFKTLEEIPERIRTLENLPPDELDRLSAALKHKINTEYGEKPFCAQIQALIKDYL
jgi:glycosyltransferase involved in cell wall biosynthesis